VAPLARREAVVGAPLRIHVEGRGLLLVEGRKALIVAARFYELHVGRDDVHDGKLLLYLFDGVGGHGLLFYAFENRRDTRRFPSSLAGLGHRRRSGFGAFGFRRDARIARRLEGIDGRALPGPGEARSGRYEAAEDDVLLEPAERVDGAFQ